MHRDLTEEQEKRGKEWVKRLFTTCVLHARRIESGDQEALRYRLELLCDMDDYLRLRHSLCGTSSLSCVDLVLFSFLRRHMELDTANIKESLHRIAHQLEPMNNLERLLT